MTKVLKDKEEEDFSSGQKTFSGRKWMIAEVFICGTATNQYGKVPAFNMAPNNDMQCRCDLIR